jgi:predicted transposase YbfD/YdcC
MEPQILSYFRTMKDPRIDRKKLHPLENLIFITIAAVICGAETYEDIEDFGYAKFEWLSGILDMKNGVPSHDTFNRFFRALNPGEFEKHFIAWAQSIISEHDYEFVSIDGKTIRQASRMNNNTNIHIVSAWASRNNLTLGQVKTSEKSNEITAIPELLESLALKDCIITIDAMGCQKEIAKKIREEKADYILAVKENHPHLYEEIRSSFSMLRSEEFESPIEADHGRIESRKYHLIHNLKHISQVAEWKGLKSIVMVDSERIHKKTGEIQRETRYYISSHKEVEKIATGIRSHWGIENKVHWLLDVVMNEDKSAKRNGYAAQNFSLVNKLALNLLRKEERKVSIRRKRKMAGWVNEYLWKILEFLKQ